METGSTYHHGGVPAAIVAAAIGRLDAEDRADLSLRSLAREIGVSATAVYRHFADKAQLTGAIAEEGFAALTGAFERACPAGEIPMTQNDAREHLARLGTAYLDFAAASPALFRLMFGPESAAYRASRLSDPGVRSASFSFLVRALGHLRANGVVERGPSEDDAMAAWALVHGHSMLMLGGVREAVPEDMRDAGRQIASRIVAQLRFLDIAESLR